MMKYVTVEVSHTAQRIAVSITIIHGSV